MLKPILWRPVLAATIERLSWGRLADEIVVATTNNPADDPIAELARRLKVGWFRESENDDLNRVPQSPRQVKADLLVECTGDCPLISVSLIDTLTDQYLSEDVEYGHILAQAFYPKSYPNDMKAELFSQMAFIQMERMETEERHKEHSTIPADEWADHFQITKTCPPDELFRPKWKLCIHTLEDFERVQRVSVNWGMSLF